MINNQITVNDNNYITVNDNNYITVNDNNYIVVNGYRGSLPTNKRVYKHYMPSPGI